MTSFPRKVLWASAFIFLLSAPVGYAANQPNASAVKETQKAAGIQTGDTVLIKVNGKAITRDDLDVAASKIMPYMSFHSSVSPEKLKQIQEKALDNIINSELVYKLAKESKQDKVDQKEIDNQIKDLRKKIAKGDTLEKALKRSNMTLAELKEDLKKSLVVERFTKKKNEEIKKKAEDTVTEAFMKDYYQKNLEKFKEPEQVQVRTILIKADPSGGSKLWAEVRKKAADIAARAKKGEDFAKLAQELSQDPYASKGGDMGWVHRGSLFEEIETTIDKLKVGDISDPVMTMYGYHIVKLEAKRPSAQKKFEDLNKENLKKELTKKEFTKLSEDWIKELRKDAKIEKINEIK